MALQKNKMSEKLTEANPAKKYSVELSLRITQDGQPFSETIQRYEEMNYEYMQNLQKLVISSLAETLLAMGDTRIPGKFKGTM